MMPVTTKAYDHYVTALHPEAFNFLSERIQADQVASFLELGTGYGDTSFKLTVKYPSLKITTLEKKPLVYQDAFERLKNTPVTVIHADALAYEPQERFDLILIDASKSQQQKLVEKYLKYLNVEGTILVDNMHISRLKKEPETRSRRALIKKHEAFIDYLKHHPDLSVSFHSLGDGLAMIKKNSENAP